MAVATGTATDYQDYWDKLLDFLQNDAALVAAGQEWTVAWEAPGGAPNETDIVLQGPGLAGSDEVLVGLRLIVDVPGDKFTIVMCGMSGVLPLAEEFDAHVNPTPVTVRMFLSSDPMDYWFVANGRRFVAVAKCSTVYEAMYGGLILPFSMPDDYPYPLFIGGSCGDGSAAVDWRGTGADHSLFHKPRYVSGTTPTSAWLLSPSGEWLRCGDNGSSSTVNIYMAPDEYFKQGFEMEDDFASNIYGFKECKDKMIECYGGDYVLTPFTLIQGSPQIQTYGVLHGVFHVPGRGNAAENIVTVDSVDHLVLQNVFRTTIGEYLAIALEE